MFIQYQYNGRVLPVRYELEGKIILQDLEQNVQHALDYFSNKQYVGNAFKFTRWSNTTGILYEMMVYRPTGLSSDFVVQVPSNIIQQVRNVV